MRTNSANVATVHKDTNSGKHLLTELILERVPTFRNSMKPLPHFGISLSVYTEEQHTLATSAPVFVSIPSQVYRCRSHVLYSALQASATPHNIRRPNRLWPLRFFGSCIRPINILNRNRWPEISYA